MAIIIRGKKQPVALISKRSVDRTPRPYSVAWISRRLAEPATRVRIAVGPLFDPSANALDLNLQEHMGNAFVTKGILQIIDDHCSCVFGS